jgi:uncharacterized flavoprotein (TIGR03862 family)
MPSVGRKLLLAGRSGLNLTHSEPIEAMLGRYGQQRRRLEQAIDAFSPADLRAWCVGLGEPTFVGSSGRVFPQSFRATPLLRAWLQRLDRLGVSIITRTRWTGWGHLPDGSIDPCRITVRTVGDEDSTARELTADVVVLALGGASWPRVGSDGGWAAAVREAGVEVHPLRPANCGVRYEWSPGFVARHGGAPVKNVAATVAGDQTSTVRGDITITDDGLEGGPVYTLSAAAREAIDRTGSATLLVDLHPDLTVAEVATRLERRRPKDSLSTALKRTLGLSPTAVALLREVCGNALPGDTAALAALVKAVPVVVRATASIDRAISSAGGIAFHEIDESFMLHRLPTIPKGKRMASNVNAIVELSPDSHDLEVSKAAGRGYYTMEEMEAFIDATIDDIYSYEVYFMIGLPKQTVQSVWDTVEYCEHLLKKYQGKNIVPYVAPMLPFLDPGSMIYDNAEEWGYKISCHSLEDHRQALLAMNWKNRLNYETKWMSRDELVDVSYKSVAKLSQLKNKYGQMPTGMTNSIVTLLDQTYAMMREIDVYQAMPESAEKTAVGVDLRKRIFEYNQKQFKMVRSQQRPVDFGFAKQQWFDTEEAFEQIAKHGVPPRPPRRGAIALPVVGADPSP